MKDYSEVWRERAIEVLTQLSSAEYQERVWRLGKGPEVSSFGEVVEDFFGMVAPANYEEEWTHLEMSAAEREALESFSRLFRRFVDSLPRPPTAQQVLDNPEWEKVRAAANAALAKF
jgi:hypothetical protein